MIRLKPEKRIRQTNYKLIIFIIVLLLVPIILFVIRNKDEDDYLSYQICDYTQQQIIENFLEYQFEDILEVKDYYFYGENFNLLTKNYQIHNKDYLIGKTLILNNVCSDQEYFYLIEDSVDGQIPLENLPLGIYEVFVNDNMVKKRVVSENLLLLEQSLVRRNDLSKVVEIISDKNMFDDNEHVDFLNNNYMFINVKEKEHQDYDIVLDPDYGTTNGYFNNFGPTTNNLVAANELLDLANGIKSQLEKAGFKVLVLRDDYDHIINLYGDNNRLNMAYDSKAKYYFQLGFSELSTGGLKVYSSSFASNHLSLPIATYLNKNTSLQILNDTGVYKPMRYNGLDGLMNIREIGGKALAAATFSEVAIEGNKNFAYNNIYGLEALYIEYLSFVNAQEVSLWEKNKEEYISASAQAIIEYMKIGVVDDISD